MDLSQLYRSVEDHPDVVEIQVTGSLPSWLRGSFYKVGNGKFDLPGGFTFNHAFDGFAIVYHYDIANGKVKYRSRYLDSDAYVKGLDVGKPLYTEFGTRSYPDPNKKLFARVFSSLVPGDLTDNNCVNIFQLRGKLFVASETCFIRELNRETLTSVCKADLNKAVGINLATSHFLEDHDGTSYNVATSFTTGLKYHVLKIPPMPNTELVNSDPLKGCEIIATVPSSWKTCFSYNHSFGMSEKYIVLIEQPLLAHSIKLLASQVQGKALKDCLGWEPTEKTRFILIEKQSGKVLPTKYVGPPFFFYHIINAYDEDGYVVFDIIAHANAETLDKFSLSKLRNNEYDQTDPPNVHRYVLPLIENLKDVGSKDNLVNLQYTSAKAEKSPEDVIVCTPEKIGEPGIELPRINFTKHGGRKYRYVYGTGLYTDGHFKRAIGKLNLETQEVAVWKGEESQCLSEPCFVPNPSGREEDDGVIITTLLDSQKENNEALLIVDAHSFKELARIEIPHRGIVGNHTLFVPS